MKPIAVLDSEGSKERRFNYRLTRARRVVENVFGIISYIFGVLRKPLLLQPPGAEEVVMTIVHLHIFLHSQRYNSDIIHQHLVTLLQMEFPGNQRVRTIVCQDP